MAGLVFSWREGEGIRVIRKTSLREQRDLNFGTQVGCRSIGEKKNDSSSAGSSLGKGLVTGLHTECQGSRDKAGGLRSKARL